MALSYLVIASEAKQSIARHTQHGLLRFARNDGCDFAISPHECARFAFNFGLLNQSEGVGDAGRTVRRSLVCEVVVVEMHTSIHSGSTRNHPASPHAMVLRLIRALPGEPCSVATVALRIKGFVQPG